MDTGCRGSGSCAARPALNNTPLNARPEETTVTAIAARFGFWNSEVLGGIPGPIRRVAFGDAEANFIRCVSVRFWPWSGVGRRIRGKGL
jgi:hypothetical protein